MARYTLLHAISSSTSPTTDPADASAALRPSPRTALALNRTRSPHGCPEPVRPDAPSRDPICRRDSLIPRVRNRRRPSPAAACRAMAAEPRRRAHQAQTTPPHGAMQRGRRRRGKSGGPPRPRDQIRPPQGPVSARGSPLRNSPRAALNLFHSVQTKSCLGHCITRGIGLRRQATILRLRGAVLFSMSASEAGAGNSDAPAGLKYLTREDFCRGCAR